MAAVLYTSHTYCTYPRMYPHTTDRRRVSHHEQPSTPAHQTLVRHSTHPVRQMDVRPFRRCAALHTTTLARANKRGAYEKTVCCAARNVKSPRRDTNSPHIPYFVAEIWPGFIAVDSVCRLRVLDPVWRRAVCVSAALVMRESGLSRHFCTIYGIRYLPDEAHLV